MADANFATDRGYNAKETISVINETLGATDLGIDSLQISHMSSAMNLSPRAIKECLSRRKHAVPYIGQGKIAGRSERSIEAAVYNDSASGRVAAMYHNNERTFSTSRFTLLRRSTFRDGLDATKLEQLQTIYERLNQARTPRDVTRIARDPYSVRRKVDKVVLRVQQLTVLQSEDPG